MTLRLARVLDAIVVGTCAAAIIAYVIVALLRIGHPFELEWLEGGEVEHVRRVLAGRGLYPAPSVDFVSYTYPPLYPWVSAAVASVIGVGFLPLRLVSFGASLGTMTVLAVEARRQAGRWVAGVVAAGIFAAAFRVAGAWYDVGRVDSLFVFLLVTAVVLAAHATSWQSGVAGGALLGLAALTKQSALVAGAPLVLLLLVRRPRVGAGFVAATGLVAGGASAWLNIASHGWYRFSTLDILLGHPLERRFTGGFWIHDIAAHAWPSVALIALVWGVARRRPNAVHAVAALGMLAAAWVSRLHTGGYDNVLIPVFAAVALLAATTFGHASRPRREWIRVAGAVLVLAQLAILAYRPAAQIPHDAATGQRFVGALRAIHGDVMVVSHPYYAVMAGKASHGQAGAIIDVVRTHRSQPRRVLERSLAEAVHHRRFAVIVFDPPDDYRGFPADLGRYYVRIAAMASGPTPIVGTPRRPADWWQARP